MDTDLCRHFHHLTDYQLPSTETRTVADIAGKALREVFDRFEIVSTGGGRSEGEGDGNRCAEAECSTAGERRIMSTDVEDELSLGLRTGAWRQGGDRMYL